MSKIEWTQRTWNPVVGCSKISPGCKNCYAIRMAWRLMHIYHSAEKYAGTVEKTGAGELNWTGKINMLQSELIKPLKWKKPQMIFVNSESDLFHESIPFEFIDAVFRVMSDVDRHIYQVLTKRPARMLEFYQWKYNQFGIPWRPKDNVWIGVSVEDQKAANERIPRLLQTPAAIHFLSCEPLLGPLDIENELTSQYYINSTDRDYIKINWVIAGGESGPDARPMHPDWVRSIRDQCQAAGVPFFFKQWGEWYDGIVRLGKKMAGRMLDGQEYNELPTTYKPAVTDDPDFYTTSCDY